MKTVCHYFDPECSMRTSGVSIRDVLSTIATRYVGENPPVPFRFRTFPEQSFFPTRDGKYILDLNKRLDALYGQSAYIAARLWQHRSEMRSIRICCHSMVTVFFNGEELWHSSTREANDPDVVTTLELPCRNGWNDLLLLCQKTPSGFGCTVSPVMPSWGWFTWLAPFSERRGQGGFVFSEPFDDTVVPFCPFSLDGPEETSGLRWFPQLHTVPDGNLDAVFGCAPGYWACAWTMLRQERSGCQKVLFSLSGGQLLVDGVLLESMETELTPGKHSLMLISCCPENGSWAFSLSANFSDGTALKLEPPDGVSGFTGRFLYLGLFAHRPMFTIPTLTGLFGDEQSIYWKSGPTTPIRPVLENTCFGRWNYPLGVTLYGLTETARLLKSNDLTEYVKRHLDTCISMHDYALYDMETYGYPEVNNQIADMRTLDDCGSFGSAMLEFYGESAGEKVRRVAERITDHIECRQERRADGAFYRMDGGHPTMWVDDLYMSVPFLCRQYKLTGDTSLIDDAARQFLLFKHYLYIQKWHLMSHVYDFKHNTATDVPWGRGNGWCLFSLSELLQTLPQDHSERESLLEFFLDLCRGVLAVQGERGLWHQVLTRSDTYEETSCTAMFICAFCRAVRCGWAGELTQKLFTAALLGWEGLLNVSVDNVGNIYGICRGSSYSFSPDYYKDELGWKLNDPHGVGVVLLAGVEIARCLAGK